LEGPAVEVRSLEPAVHLPVALVWRRERNGRPPPAPLGVRVETGGVESLEPSMTSLGRCVELVGM
jgi:hypothetical protein